jgi:UrcA family protein
MIKPFALFAAVGLASLALPLHAADKPSVSVAHTDLDLTKPADRIRLERRVRAATAKVCPPLGRVLKMNWESAKCRELAATQAAPQVRAAINSAGPDLDRIRLAVTEGTGRS